MDRRRLNRRVRAIAKLGAGPEDDIEQIVSGSIGNLDRAGCIHFAPFAGHLFNDGPTHLCGSLFRSIQVRVLAARFVANKCVICTVVKVIFRHDKFPYSRG